MRTSKRLGALCSVAGAALMWVAPGCSDKDHTEICVGPNCFGAGAGGTGSVLQGGAGGVAGEAGGAGTAGESGAAGTAGESGSGGTAGSPEEPTDAGADAQLDGGEDIDIPDSSDGVGGSTGEPDATVDPLPDGGADAAPPGPVCTLAFTSPLGVDGGELSLSGSDDVDGEACGAEFTIRVSVASNARSVTLFVNDNPLVPQDVVDGAVDIDAVLGNRGSTLNVLRAEALMEDGSTCDAVFPSSLQVSCPGPSCSIESPVANDDGYLNAAQDGAGDPGLQTDIVVSTEVEHVGETVRLEIDGDLDVVDDESVADTGATGSATFLAVSLSESEHTVRAECSDAFGVTTLSPPTVWKIDVTPCSLALASVGGNDPLTPADDEDTNTPGIQVFAAGQITGDDCKSLLLGVCGQIPLPIELSLPPTGLFDDLLVTVSGSTGVVEMCGTVQDDAGNTSAEDRISVNLRLEAPAVSLTTPTGSNTHYNLQSDGSGGNTSCETDVVASCSEEGIDVKLFADGSEIASETCTGGQVTFAQASIPSKNDGGLTALTVQQTASGFPPAVSDAVEVQADCDAPTCSITGPNTGIDFLNSTLDSDVAVGFQVDFAVTSNGSSVGLSIDSTAFPTPPDFASGVATFADVSLGQGERSVQALCTDAAGNETSSSTEVWTVDSVPCGLTSLVVNDGVTPVIPPTLEVNVDGQTTGGDCASVRAGAGLCAALTGGFTDVTPLDQDFSDLGVTLPSVTDPAADLCVEVLDAAGNLAQFPSTVAVRVDAPTVAITSPADQDEFLTLTACGISVVVSCSDAGSPVELSIDGGPGVTEDCTVDHDATFAVTLPNKNDGTPTSLSALQTADGLTSLPSSIDVFSDCDGPDNAVAAPLFSNLVPHRENVVRLSYSTVLDNDGGALSAFHLKCSVDPIVDELTWTAATELTPVSGGPQVEIDADTALSKRYAGFRSGTTTHCAVRGEDDAGLLTPISLNENAVVTNPFTATPYSSVPAAFAALTTTLFSVAPVGDVNGDTLPGDIRNDFIIGYAQRPAQVYFGGSTPSTTPNILINPTMTPAGRFGQVVAGLGDINNDGRPDFAIGAPNVSNGGLNAGSVFVFFGRTSSNPWPVPPTTIDVAAAPGCGADICFHGSVVQSLFGSAVTSTDFDGDGELDIVIGAPFPTAAGSVYVVLGGPQLAALPANAVVNVTATTASVTAGPLNGFLFTPPAATVGQTFGTAIAAVGVGSDSHGDLAIGASGTGAAYFQAGEDYPAATTGLVTRVLGTPFATGAASDFGFPIVALGDFDGAFDPDFPNVRSDDVCVGGDYVNGGRCNVYLRQTGGFDSTVENVLPYTNDLTDNKWGRYAADGFHSAFGLLGDLDKDGIGELAVGALIFNTRPGTVELFYGADPAVARPRSKADAKFLTTGQANLGVNFVGDIDGDGFNDLALFEGAFGVTSRLTLLH